MSHLPPNDYFNKHYLADLEVFGIHRGYGEMMCGISLSHSLRHPQRLRFKALAEFLVCQFELNLLNQAIYDHFSCRIATSTSQSDRVAAHAEWRDFSAPFADLLNCYYGHGMHHRPDEILRFAQEPRDNGGPDVTHVSLTWDILHEYTTYFFQEYLSRFTHRSGPSSFSQESFLQDVARDNCCTACVQTSSGWETKHVIELLGEPADRSRPYLGTSQHHSYFRGSRRQHMPNGDELPRKRKCRRVVKELLEKLTALRNRIAGEEGHTPQTQHCIFNSDELGEMAVEQPQTLEEFREISGVGDIKCQMYGEKFTRLVNDYLTSEQPPILNSSQLAALLIPVKAIQLALNFHQPVNETVKTLLAVPGNDVTAHSSRRFRCFLALVAAERCRRDSNKWTKWISIAIKEGELLDEHAQIDLSKEWMRVRDALDLESFYSMAAPKRDQHFSDTMEDLGITFAVEADGDGHTFFCDLQLQRILDDGDSVYPFNVEDAVEANATDPDIMDDAVADVSAVREVPRPPLNPVPSNHPLYDRVYSGDKPVDIARDLKSQYPSHVIFVQNGCFRETYGSDAHVCSGVFGWTVATIGGHVFTGVPVNAFRFKETLVSRSMPYIMVDQVEFPANGPLVERKVVELFDA